MGKGSGFDPFETNIHHPVDDGDLFLRGNELVLSL
jgi:hypothetical protein